MAVVRFKQTLKESMETQIKDAIDAGSGPGILQIYSGSMPATPETSVTTQTLLGTLTFSDPCGTIGSGTLTMSAITQDASADNGGTAAWARILDSTGSAVMDVDVSATTGTGAIKLNTVTIVAGGPIRIDSCTITFP